MTDQEINILILLSGPPLLAMVVTIYDWLARRQHRREREHRRSA
jgi:hypothetical protein